MTEHGTETKLLDKIKNTTCRVGHSKSPGTSEDTIPSVILNSVLSLGHIQYKHPYRSGKTKKKCHYNNV